ncbi:glycogen synthase [Candidatus Falkowbacteria bacterium]|nr:glycogen synthase [Candidatus Falkowbacteria bacterium]
MSNKLKIVSISSEVAPFAKTGGLADVARSLPKALKRLGHDVVMIMPFYGKIIDVEEHNLKMIMRDVKIYLNDTEAVTVNFWQGYLMKGLPIYFVEQKKYFSQRKALYGSDHENVRFFIFNAAALKLLSLLKFEADIIHCHDWQTGLVPFLLRNDFRYSKTLRKAKTIYTIHNLVFQMGHNWWEVPPAKKDFGKKALPKISNPDFENINFAKRAILHADVVNTVSEQYREEIMTRRFGQDLHHILRNRQDRLFGIINGIDYRTYNPANDKQLFKNYDYRKIHRKKLNKEFLQQKLKLPIDRDMPIISLTSRVTFQKGFELVMPLLEPLTGLDVQIIIMGDGDKKYISELKKQQKKHPKKLVWIPFSRNKSLETLVYAGSDVFLLPSHHEPCGINQLIAMRYGCIPVVRRVGGLHDTVTNFNPRTNRGTGFSFSSFNTYSLFATIIRALEDFRHKEVWRSLTVRAMKESNSWELPAKKYLALYKKAIKLNGKNVKHKI